MVGGGGGGSWGRHSLVEGGHDRSTGVSVVREWDEVLEASVWGGVHQDSAHFCVGALGGEGLEGEYGTVNFCNILEHYQYDIIDIDVENSDTT